jgi:cell division protein FtsQ
MDNDKRLRKSNELIVIRKKKILIKRTILLSILLIVLLCTLCLKLPYFNIATVEVKNNRNISAEEVVALSGITGDNNIFYINLSRIKSGILSNPYILEVNIKRRLPDSLILNVQEREALFYVLTGNQYAVLDGNATLLEIRDSIQGMDLVKVEGIKVDSMEPGMVIDQENNRTARTLAIFADLIRRNSSGINFSSVDLSNLININLYISNMCIKLGNNENLEKKLNKALNIIQHNEVNNSKGYIDVSFEGNPVLYIEK